MTEEEKQVILNLKDFMYRVDNKYKLNKTNSKILKDILNLIDKQQKEIEQLANGIRVLGTNPDITTEEIIKEFTEKPITEKYMAEFKSRYISKDKIREKIKKLEKLYEKEMKPYQTEFGLNLSLLTKKE